MAKDWNQVCPNCNGTAIEHIGAGGESGACVACDGTGDFDTFLYNLLAGEIERDGLGWGPAFDGWYKRANQ